MALIALFKGYASKSTHTRWVSGLHQKLRNSWAAEADITEAPSTFHGTAAEISCRRAGLIYVKHSLLSYSFEEHVLDLHMTHKSAQRYPISGNLKLLGLSNNHPYVNDSAEAVKNRSEECRYEPNVAEIHPSPLHHALLPVSTSKSFIVLGDEIV